MFYDYSCATLAKCADYSADCPCLMGQIYKNMLIFRGNVLKYDRFPRIIE